MMQFNVLLRICGDHVPFDQITQTLGLTPAPRLRDCDGSGGSECWQYTIPDQRDCGPSEQLRTLWRTIKSNANYLKMIGATVKIECRWRGEPGSSEISMAPDVLLIFLALEIPLHLSFHPEQAD